MMRLFEVVRNPPLTATVGLVVKIGASFHLSHSLLQAMPFGLLFGSRKIFDVTFKNGQEILRCLVLTSLSIHLYSAYFKTKIINTYLGLPDAYTRVARGTQSARATGLTTTAPIR